MLTEAEKEAVLEIQSREKALFAKLNPGLLDLVGRGYLKLEQAKTMFNAPTGEFLVSVTEAGQFYLKHCKAIV